MPPTRNIVSNQNHRASLTRFAWLSIAAAVITILLKTSAYFLTGSVGLLSDALESGVNLVAAVFALVALTIAARPPDDDHAYGHDKVEYFSSGMEGTLIIVAALTIAAASLERLFNPRPLEQVGVGLAVSVLASVINLIVARVLLRAGKKHESITLEADARHLMTDVWTSVGVVIGVAAVALTGWEVLDPLIGIAVAVNIIWMGYRLMRRSVLGLTDTALPEREREQIEGILAAYAGEGVQYHALRTRQAGSRRFMSVHVLVPGGWSVKRSHDMVERIERDVRAALANVTMITHLEPLGDPASLEDIPLYREDEANA